MIDPAKLMEHLVGAGLVRAEQFEEAKRCVVAQKVSLDKALVLLNIVGYETLGKCLSDIHQMPYVPVLTAMPTAQVRGFMSKDCAAVWKVFPWLFDADENLLTVAIHDVIQISLLEKMSKFFMQSHSLAFTVASEAEIEEALIIHYGVKRRLSPFGEEATSVTAEPVPGAAPAAQQAPAAASRDELLERKKTPLLAKAPGEEEGAKGGAPEKPRLAVSEVRGGDAGVAGGRRDRGKPGSRSAAELSYQDMSRALISAGAFVAKERLSSVPGGLQKIQSRVRYCELLAGRMNLSPVHIDGLILAAWLSAVEQNREFIEEFATPYRIEGIMYAVDTGKGAPRPEALIYSLVKSFQEYCDADPDGARDINLTRRQMHKVWSSAPERQKMLETFLQVLVDEQFLSKLDRMTGKILIVDPSERAVSMIVPPLTSHGYDVRSVPTARAADELMKDYMPDVILCEKELQFVNGLHFCRKLKQEEKTATIKFIMMSSLRGEQNAAESLRAGADDYVAKPVDMEVLFLKVDKLIAPKADVTKEGVTGLLKDMSFNDMIQILSAGGKSMEVVLTRNKEEGHVFIQGGEIVHATAGPLSGADAFYALMGWQEGEFTTRSCEKYPERTITSSTMSLLMEGARMLDEKKAAESAEKTAEERKEEKPEPAEKTAGEQKEEKPEPAGKTAETEGRDNGKQ